jgi:putative endonuclease
MTAKDKSAQDLGRNGETLAKEWLISQGFDVLFSNVYTEYGEIDVIAMKGERLHFVELKTRRTKIFGHPEDAITERKAAHMVDSARRYLQLHPEFDGDWQIDVIAIQIEKEDGKVEIRRFENAV